MENLKLNLIEILEKEGLKRENYKIGSYAVYVYYINGVFENLEIYNLDRDGYIPNIYFKYRTFTEVVNEFKISTVSYGSLDPEKITEVIKGYEQAMKVVEILKNEFFNK